MKEQTKEKLNEEELERDEMMNNLKKVAFFATMGLGLSHFLNK